MRALARKLAAPSTADDLVQKAYVRALERPPRPRGSLRGWLTAVLRNLAREERRSAFRRAARERDAARDDAVPSPVDRLAAHQDVVQALLALAEPYRTAVIRRFYEDLSPRAIAERDGVPVATVKSRVQRGLALLRARLAAERMPDGRTKLRALLPVLAARAPGAPPASVSAGALAGGLATPAVCAVAVVGLAAVLASVARDGRASTGGVSATLAPAGDPNGDPGSESRLAAPAAGRTARRAAGAGAAVPEPALDGRPLLVTLERPDGQRTTPAGVRATLVDEGGHALVVEARGEDRLVFPSVAFGAHELVLEGDGFLHRARTVELREEDLCDPDGGIIEGSERRGSVFAITATLWPDGWIPVVVRAPDGRPFASLAADDGLEPRRYFADAFVAAARREPIAPGAPNPPATGTVARFRPPDGYQSVEVVEGVAGSLELLEPPPFHVGLWFHGALVASEALRPGDTEVVFTLGRAAFEAGLATVTLRVIDRDTSAPARDARVTLKAETSAHRRDDLTDAEPDADGKVRLERVVPGRHELFVAREGHAVQRWLELAAGEERALGDVPIGAGPALPVRVVDEAGRAVLAVLEIAPYERGRSVEELYHPNLHRTTSDDGTSELPVPDRPSVVRTRGFGVSPTLGGISLGGAVASANVLLDPAALPAELVLVSRPRARVRLEPRAPWVAGDRVRFVDELGLVVLEVAPDDAEGLEAELVAGAYEVERWRADVLVGSGPAVVSAGDEPLRVP